LRSKAGKWFVPTILCLGSMHSFTEIHPLGLSWKRPDSNPNASIYRFFSVLKLTCLEMQITFLRCLVSKLYDIWESLAIRCYCIADKRVFFSFFPWRDTLGLIYGAQKTFQVGNCKTPF